MHRIKLLLLVILLLLLSFITYILLSSGFFRTIEPHLNGQILKEVPLKGAEDISTSWIDSFALISATHRFSYPKTKEEHGALYYMELKNNAFTLTNLTPQLPFAFAPHGISMLKTDSTYTVLAINHTEEGHTIEVFRLIGTTLLHQQTLTDPSMVSPNDVVLVDQNRFYFTNDHHYTKGLGKLAEEYLGLAISSIVYFDGNTYQKVANDLAYANGINVDLKRHRLFASSLRHFQMKIYAIQKNGSLQFIENIPCGFGIDNIELDKHGHIWTAGHPNLLQFQSYSKGKRAIAPSEIIKIAYKGKEDYNIESIYVEDGKVMSGASVASPFGNLVLTGNVMDDKFLILELTN